MSSKNCSTCKINKPFTDFYKDKSKKTGYKSQCKACKIVYARKKNPPKRTKQVIPKGTYSNHKEWRKHYNKIQYQKRKARLLAEKEALKNKEDIVTLEEVKNKAQLVESN